MTYVFERAGLGLNRDYRRVRHSSSLFKRIAFGVLGVVIACIGHEAVADESESNHARAVAAFKIANPVVAQQNVERIDDSTVDVEEGYTLAKQAFEHGLFEASIFSLQNILSADDTHIPAWELYKRNAQRVGYKPALIMAHARLTQLYLKVGQQGLAIKRYHELKALSPEHQGLGRLAEDLGLSSTDDVQNSWGERLRSLLGMVVLVGICIAWSQHRSRISWRVVGWGLGLQLLFALFILKTPAGRAVFSSAKVAIERVLSFTDEGAGFLFGHFYRGNTLEVRDNVTGDAVSLAQSIAFDVLPTIIFFGALMSVLYHLGIVQWVVKSVAWVMQRTMGTSGAESLSAAGNIFVGQTEAPLLIRPYLAEMTKSELMAVMVGGFATVAGGVLAFYVSFGVDAGHLLAASVMSAPAALMVAKILYPETEEPKTKGTSGLHFEKSTSNLVDAAASGASDGLKLALNVAAMLVAFIALVAMLNAMLSALGGFVGMELSLQKLFGYLFAPLAWVMGVSNGDLLHFGNLLGTKLAVNEFLAYTELAALKTQISPRTSIIATYALCGFANFSSIGIQIGGLSAIVPERRKDLASIGLKAMAGGAIASWLTACLAGILL